MADISSYLAAIMAAVYGEDVRGSIHDAIDIINKVGEVVLNTGTAVTGPTSSSTGFYDGSFYINTNTMELWKCIGTNAWQSQGVLKGADGADGNGIVSIVKTASVGLVDTYTITFDDGTTETYQITNGQNGSKWYKGTAISGTGTSITGFPGNMNDFYLNSTDGYVYICTKTGGSLPPDAAEWDYVMTLTGGGGGSITVIDNLTSTSSTDALSANQGRVLKGMVDAKIENPSTKSDGQVLTYDGTNQIWKAQNPSAGSLSSLTDTQITSPASGQILEYDANNNRWINAENVSSFAKFGGSLTFSQLTSSLLVAANEDKFFLVTDGGTISSADAGNWILPQGSVIPADSHIAVVNVGTSAVPSYKFDDFGGYVDLSGLAEKTDLDGWSSTAQVQSDNTVTFTGLDDSYAYDLYCQDKLIGVSSMQKTGSGLTTQLVFTVTGASAGDVCKLRIVK